MKTNRFTPAQITEAAALLKAGEVVAFPTETVYGLGAIATDPKAVAKVFAAKHRPADNPLIVTVATTAMVAEYATITPAAQQLMTAFWPGPLTIILPVLPGRLPAVVTGGLSTAAFRLPASAVTRDLIAATGVPIVGPSANLSTKPSATKAEHVLHDFDGVIAGVVDAGPTPVGVESTVIDMTVTPPAILRPGKLGPADLEPIIGPVQADHHHVAAGETPKAPGMKYKHYAPAAQVVIVDAPADWPAALAWAKVSGTAYGVLASPAILATVPTGVPTYALGGDIQAATHNLFAGLRWFDLHPSVSLVLAQAYPATGLGAAYMNRLDKSAGGRHFTQEQA